MATTSGNHFNPTSGTATGKTFLGDVTVVGDTKLGNVAAVNATIETLYVGKEITSGTGGVPFGSSIVIAPGSSLVEYQYKCEMHTYASTPITLSKTMSGQVLLVTPVINTNTIIYLPVLDADSANSGWHIRIIRDAGALTGGTITITAQS